MSRSGTIIVCFAIAAYAAIIIVSMVVGVR